MKFTKIPTDTFKEIALNAGILLDDFDPLTQDAGNILGATSGGVNFTATPTYEDFGEDIDNCPKNMLELKKLTAWEVAMSGTFITVSATLANTLVGAADLDEANEEHIIPRNDIYETDFKDLWWVGDYSNVNTGENAGFIAIHMLNSLSTGGFQIQSTDNAKGQFAFTFTGHYSMSDQTQVPFEIYVKQGGEDTTPSVLLDSHALTIDEEGTATLTATTIPASQSVTWTSSDDTVASVADGVITAESAGNAIITATITVDGVSYTDTCTVIVNEAE